MEQLITDQAGRSDGGARRRRPLLASLTTLGVVTGLLGVAGVFAAGSDSATTGTNDAISGEFDDGGDGDVDLQLASATMDYETGTFTCGDDWSDDLATGVITSDGFDLGQQTPYGDYDEGAVCVRNLGSEVASLGLTAFDLVDLELACSEREADVDDTCGPEGLGELSDQLAISAYTAAPDTTEPGANCWGSVGDPVFLSALAAGSSLGLPHLGAGETIGLCLGAGWLRTDGTQTDQSSWRFLFDAIGDGEEPPGGGYECTEDDGFEENDDIATATPYTVPVSATSCDGDADWYAVSHPGGNLEVLLDHLDGEDLDIYVTDASGETLGGAASGANPEFASVELDPGTYYLQVVGFDGSESTYQLSVGASTPVECIDDAREDVDDDHVGATPIDGAMTGLACEDDLDFYRYETDGGTISAVLSSTDEQSDLDLYLVQSDGDDGYAILASSESAGSDESVAADVDGGTYYLVVSGYATPNGATPYTLTALPPA